MSGKQFTKDKLTQKHKSHRSGKENHFLVKARGAVSINTHDKTNMRDSTSWMDLLGHIFTKGNRFPRIDKARPSVHTVKAKTKKKLIRTSIFLLLINDKPPVSPSSNR